MYNVFLITAVNHFGFVQVEFEHRICWFLLLCVYVVFFFWGGGGGGGVCHSHHLQRKGQNRPGDDLLWNGGGTQIARFF